MTLCSQPLRSAIRAEPGVVLLGYRAAAVCRERAATYRLCVKVGNDAEACKAAQDTAATRQHPSLSLSSRAARLLSPVRGQYVEAESQAGTHTPNEEGDDDQRADGARWGAPGGSLCLHPALLHAAGHR